jgi:hypothetical protein
VVVGHNTPPPLRKKQGVKNGIVFFLCGTTKRRMTCCRWQYPSPALFKKRVLKETKKNKTKEETNIKCV